jgi:hydroxyacylglutathione hydrolase
MLDVQANFNKFFLQGACCGEMSFYIFLNMALQIIPILALKDNYIWLLYKEGQKAAIVVDPGVAPPVLQALARYQLSLSAILITHHHWDHTQGVAPLLRQCPPGSIAVFGPAKESIPYLTQALRDKDRINLLEAYLSLEVLEIPGHTRGHIAYFSRDAKPYPLLFSGDTLFGGGCGKLFEGTAIEMYHSLVKLCALPNQTRIYCGHEYTEINLSFAHWLEPNNRMIQDRLYQVRQLKKQSQSSMPSLLEEEKLTNPFLRCDQPAFLKAIALSIDSMQSITSVASPSAVQIFEKIRKLKDNWQG